MEILRRKWKKLIVILSILIISFSGFVIYTLDYYHSLPVAQEILNEMNIEYGI